MIKEFEYIELDRYFMNHVICCFDQYQKKDVDYIEGLKDEFQKVIDIVKPVKTERACTDEEKKRYKLDYHKDLCNALDYEKCYTKAYQKAERLLSEGCVYSDFGTRRRASFEAEDTIVRAMSTCQKSRQWEGTFVGTSNVYLAMKYDLTPVGTMAHEFVCAIAAMHGPQMANHMAMNAWRHTFRGALGTFLYDSFGWHLFSLNFSEDFANLFKGLRIDSGDNYEQLNKIVQKYRSLGIDPLTKQVIFSNALDTDRAIEIHRYAKNYCQPSFGIGTRFTNDFEDVKPMNIVIKLVAAKITESWDFYNDTCKLSEDKGKHTGKPEVIRRYMDIIHFHED